MKRGAKPRTAMLRFALRGLLACVLAAGIASSGRARLPPLHPPTVPLPRNIDAMIGQMLVIGFYGTGPGDVGVRSAVRDLRLGLTGGVILMDRNVRSPRQVRALTAEFRAVSRGPIPLIAIDQEGGSVQRLSAKKGFRAYPSPRRLASRKAPDEAYAVYRWMADELVKAGINLNFGPVVDLDVNTGNPIIGRRGRSFGADPERVTDFARAFMTAHQDAGVLTSLKHFPGHGSSRTDSHVRLVDLSHLWSEQELAPYESLAAEGRIDTIMVGHLYHPAFADEPIPATLAPKAIAWLRSSLGFNGVVITDDLGMGAIRNHRSVQQSLVQAVAAGNDLLLVANPGHDRDFARQSVENIRAAVEDGRIPVQRITESYRRIMALKRGLVQRRAEIDQALKAAGSH